MYRDQRLATILKWTALPSSEEAEDNALAVRRVGQIAVSLLEMRLAQSRFAALRALVRLCRTLDNSQRRRFVALAKRYGMDGVGRRLAAERGRDRTDHSGCTERADDLAVPRDGIPEPSFEPPAMPTQLFSSDAGAQRRAMEAPVMSDRIRRPQSGAVSDAAIPAVREGAERLAVLIDRIDKVRRQLSPVDEGEPASELAWKTNARGIFTQTPQLIAADRFDRLALLAFSESDRVQARIAAHQPLNGERFRVDGEVLTLSGTPIFAQRTGAFLGYVGRISVERQFDTLGLQPEQVAEAAHEILTPLNAILGYAQMIEREVLGPAPSPLRSDAKAIIRDAGQLLSIVNALGDAAALQRGATSETGGELVPASSLIESLESDYAEDIASRGLLADFRAAGISNFRADGDALLRALRRLTSVMVSLLRPGECLSIIEEPAGIRIAMPPALTGRSAASLIGGPIVSQGQGSTPQLGLSFALKLVRQLLDRSGGELCIEPGSFLLRVSAHAEGDCREAS